MGRSTTRLGLLVALAACSGSPPAGDAGVPAEDAGELDAGAVDAGPPADAGSVDAGLPDAGVDGGCFVATVGVFGECELTSDCAAMGAYTSTAGYCPGPANIECCWLSPNVANNPAVPIGWVLMPQSAVTAPMTAWAVMILDDPTSYPMFSVSLMTFGTLQVMARVEWHPPDFQNGVVHRGVTLYQPG